MRGGLRHHSARGDEEHDRNGGERVSDHVRRDTDDHAIRPNPRGSARAACSSTRRKNTAHRTTSRSAGAAKGLPPRRDSCASFWRKGRQGRKGRKGIFWLERSTSVAAFPRPCATHHPKKSLRPLRPLRPLRSNSAQPSRNHICSLAKTRRSTTVGVARLRPWRRGRLRGRSRGGPRASPRGGRWRCRASSRRPRRRSRCSRRWGPSGGIRRSG